MHTFTRMLAGFRLHVRVLVALVLALALVGAAASATASTYFRGKTKQGPKVTFRTTATKVIGFKTSASVLCVSAASATSFTDIYPVNMPSRRIKNGHFTITFKIPTNSLSITATGIVKAKSASGKLSVGYNKTRGTTPTGLLDIYACFVKTTWTAKKV